ncbi:hypothetical protein R9X47_07655 [Wukongibacter baidiensis]|uniref:alpha/beta hydrolase n=1 Tax=Wukongibacter baidiensis TaxID=1723361 RepID=UPI003D7F3310
MFQTYQELDNHITGLWQQEKFSEIIELFKAYIDAFPENNYYMTWEMALGYASLGDLEKAYNILEDGLGKGYFYPIFPDDSLFNKHPYEERFKNVLTKIEKLKLQKQSSAHVKYVLESPESYSKDTPILISLHGWGEDMEFFKCRWNSQVIKEKFHHLFIQSSQVCTYNGYCWDNYDKTIEDINIALDNVKANLGFSPRKMFAGGFSQGGEIAIDLCLKTNLPIRGVVVLCPGLDEKQLSLEENLLSSQLSHVTIITGENDGDLQSQKVFVDRLRGVEVEHKFIVIENLGHWFPSNLSNLLDDAADGFLKKFNK